MLKSIGVSLVAIAATAATARKASAQNWCPSCYSNFEIEMHQNPAEGFAGNSGPAHQIFMPYICAWTHPDFGFCYYSALLAPMQEELNDAARVEWVPTHLAAQVQARAPGGLLFDPVLMRYYLAQCEGAQWLGYAEG
jgi:hypothetical protein